MDPESSEKSRKNILDAIDLEVDNAKFYACASRKTKDEQEAAVFKRLGKIEAEHAEALAEVLDIPEKEIPEYEECSEEASTNYREANEREERAIKSYSRFASEAEEPIIKELFEAIVKIERDHLDLSKRKISN